MYFFLFDTIVNLTIILLILILKCSVYRNEAESCQEILKSCILLNLFMPTGCFYVCEYVYVYVCVGV